MPNTKLNWTVTLSVVAHGGPADTDQLFDLIERLASYGASVTGTPEAVTDECRYGVTLTMHAYSADDAIKDAMRKVLGAASLVGLPSGRVVRADARDDGELDVELARPVFPAIVGKHEVADLLGVTRQRVNELAARPDFPQPVAHLKLQSGPIWTLAAVQRFIDNWARIPGLRTARPKAEPPPAAAAPVAATVVRRAARPKPQSAAARAAKPSKKSSPSKAAAKPKAASKKATTKPSKSKAAVKTAPARATKRR